MLNRISELLTTHSTYDYYRPDWQSIKDLKEGYPTIRNKSERYLPARIGEEPDVYNNRLSCLSYTNLLSENVHRLASILAASPVNLEYQDETFWLDYLQKMDGAHLTHNRLIYNTYAELLHYGRVCIAVDNPPDVYPARSMAEYEVTRPYPKVTFFHPLEVLNWDEGWVKTLQINESNDPLSGRSTWAYWKLWTEDSITTWVAEVTVDIDNVITQVKVGNKWLHPMDKKAVAEGRTVSHNLGRLPIVYRILQDEEWVGSAVYSKCIQHLNIESAWTWAGRYAGIIQRVFTPSPPIVNDNPNLLLEPPDYSQVISDNAHILIGNNFQFVETSGVAIQSHSGQLERIRDDVRDTVNITFASASKTGVEQSGVSKKVDLILLKNALTTYGAYGEEVDNEVLALSALWVGLEPPETQFNHNYSLEGLDTYLDTADRLMPHAENLAPITLNQFYRRLQHAILPDADENTKKKIEEETPTFEDDPEADPNTEESPDDLKTRLMDAYDLSEDEADFVITGV